MRADAIETYERAYYPQGIGRHFGAVLGSGSLRRYDTQISAPTVVIHGRADKLMRPAGGRAIARAIPGARLVLFDGMGHDLPEPLLDDIIGELTATFAQFATQPEQIDQRLAPTRVPLRPRHRSNSVRRAGGERHGELQASPRACAGAVVS